MSTYYYSRYQGWWLVVLANNKQRACDRLVEFVRITKGNVGIDEQAIRKEAKIDPIHFVDDTGYYTDLGKIDLKLAKVKQEMGEKIKEVEQELQRFRDAVKSALSLEQDNDDREGE